MTMSMYPPPQMAVMETLVPPGTIVPTVKAAADAGYLLCDGASYAKADYPALFAALGGELSVWGGVTSTHFAVPDLRGRVPVGSNGDNQSDKAIATLGSVVGAKEHTLAVAEMPSHNHGSSTGGHTHTGAIAGSDTGFLVANSSGGGAYTAPPGSGRLRIVGSTQSGDGTHTHTTQGSGSAHNNVQPSVGVTYQIKA